MASKDKNVQITVNAKNSASNTFTQLSKDVNGTATQLQALGNLPGPLGAALSKVSSAFSDISQAAQAAGSVGGSALGGLALPLGALVLSAAAVVAAIAAIGTAAYGAANKAADWFKSVRNFSEETGTSMEFTSVLASGAELAGTSIDNFGTSLDRVNTALEQSDTAAQQASNGIGKASKQLQRLSEDYAQSVADTETQLTENLADQTKQRTRQAQSYYQQLGDLEEQHKQQISDQEQQISDIIASYQDSAAQRQEDYNDRQAQRQETLNDQLAAIDSKASDERAGIMSQYANANTDLGKAARESELAALDERTKAEKDKLTNKYDSETAREKKQLDETNTRAKSQEDQQITRLQSQIDRENAAYAKQTQRQQQEYAQRVTDFDEAQAKMEASTQKALDRAAKQYARSTADVADSMTELSSKAEEASGKAARALEKLGIDAKKFKDESPDQQIKDLIDGMNGLLVPADKVDRANKMLLEGVEDTTDATDRERAAYDLFGRFAVGPWLQTARIVKEQGWDQLTQSAKDTGHWVGPEYAKSAQQFIDESNQINYNVEGLAITAGQKAIPAFVTFGAVLEQFSKGDIAGGFESLNTLLVNKLESLSSSISQWAGGLFGTTSHATGGDFNAGDRMLVGEQGPELVKFGRGGRVYSNGDTQQMLSSSERHDHYNMTVITQAQAPTVIQDFAMMRSLAAGN